MSAQPFAEGVAVYALAGWPVVPVPPETKTPPPAGFTGPHGDADTEQLVRWAGTHASSSIAIRMPEGVIGIDVDDYAKGEVVKTGGATLAARIAGWGPLPATWSSTARGPGPSRIHFFRVPAQRYATVLGDHVEIIQRHHRYAVVWPSMHVGAGAQYQWYDPHGLPCAPPKPNELPELPQVWVDGLREGASSPTDLAAPQQAGELMWAAIAADGRPACAQMASAVLDAHRLIEASSQGTRHDVADDRAWNLVQLAADGHPGLGVAIDDLTALWDTVTAGEDRGDEWRRLFVTAARKAVTRIGRSAPVDRDPCFEGMGLTLVPAPAPGSLPGETPADPIAPATPWSVREHIGAHLFDPPFHLDQALAQAVLERTYPVMRYAYDSHGWLRRGPEYWEDLSDLSEWAISELAQLMPHGDPAADKESEAFAQAARRRRFMSGSPSGAIAKKMRALLAAGTHPCSVAAARLDSEPWLLWAGGVPWDLRASLREPIAAAVDPAIPHLRAAAMRPDVRPTPLWDAFTAAVWPDPELRRWALRVLSVAFTGDSAKVLPILVGEGDRGKTQVVVLLMSVLGSYAHAADPRLLGTADRSHASIVTALKGRRLSFIDEAPRDNAASQERLKQITGGGELTGNDMGRNPITFTPTHTLVLTANEPPLLTDPAVRRRVRLIPCEGDPAEVIAARAAIGHQSGGAWRQEAPGVLAAMMAEAAGWLADERTGRTEAAPEAYRYRAELIAAEQNIVASWIDALLEPDDVGTVGHELRKSFVAWGRDAGLRDTQLPSLPKWGLELTRLGYPVIKRRDGNYRGLRIRPLASWPAGGGFTHSGGGFVEGSAPTLHGESNPPQPPESQGSTLHASDGVEGVEGLNLRTHTHAHAGAHTHERWESPSTPPPLHTEARPAKPPTSESARITAALLGDRGAPTPAVPAGAILCGPGPLTDADAAAVTAFAEQLTAAAVPAQEPARRTKVDPAERAAAKAAAKQAELEARIAAAAGPPVVLPAVVTRDGQVRPVTLAGVAELAAAFGFAGELTVDVEHTGFPIGHADYALRTVQAGDDRAALVFDADDPSQLDAAGTLIRSATVLHAHSATADLVPLAIAGAIDLEDAWARMHDTVIPALLADPASTGSDADGLKALAGDVLPDATSPAADEARAALFKAGKWLTKTKATTPLARSGWAQVDRTCTTMVRYAASDVLDAAALARRLPPVPPALLERERTAQRMTARIAHLGVRLDGEHVDAKLPEHRAELAAAAERIRAFGVAEPGSDQQIGAKLIELGAPLPRTPKTGRPSVAKGGLNPFAKVDGPVGDLVRARLDYQHHETVLGLFLDPYAQLVHRGDGRARPTVYTLGAETGRMSCVQSDALIEMPRDLAKYPDGVPITDVRAGDWVYAFDHRRELVLRRVKWCAQTGVRQTMIITAENSDGHRLMLRATPEHLIRLRNGDYRATELLLTTPGKPRRDGGPRLMTMVRRQVDDGYVKFFPHSVARHGAGVRGGGIVREHRFVVQQTTGVRLSTKTDVNHVDGNRANNDPANLQPLTIAEHRGNRDLAWGIDQDDLVLPSGPTDYRVISIGAGPIEPVWDMEVDEVHNFIANGICVHNCVRPNLQQVPRQGGIRRCITADPGELIVSADFASVEVRVAAALTGDANLRAMLDAGIDLHMQTARQAYGEGATKEDRYNTKRAVFGRLYGSGIPGIARTLGISDSEAAAIVASLDAITPQMTQWIAGLKQSVQRGLRTFDTYSGRTVHLDARQPHKAFNYCVQGTARELLVDALMRWRDTRWGQCRLMPVHDEVLVFVPEDEAADATAALVAAMESELYGVAIKAEASEPSFSWKDAS